MQPSRFDLPLVHKFKSLAPGFIPIDKGSRGEGTTERGVIPLGFCYRGPSLLGHETTTTMAGPGDLSTIMLSPSPSLCAFSRFPWVRSSPHIISAHSFSSRFPLLLGRRCQLTLAWHRSCLNLRDL